MSKRKRHSPEQIVGKLREADALLNAGQTIGQVLQRLGVSEATFHRWRTQYGGMKALAGSWKNEYNHRRPHSSLGYRTPASFAASLSGPPVGAAPLRPALPATDPLPETLITAGT